MSRSGPHQREQFVVTIHHKRSPAEGDVFVFDSEQDAINSVRLTFPGMEMANVFHTKHGELNYHWIDPGYGRDLDLVTIHRRPVETGPRKLLREDAFEGQVFLLPFER
jgi:hypothetical protein